MNQRHIQRKNLRGTPFSRLFFIIFLFFFTLSAMSPSVSAGQLVIGTDLWIGNINPFFYDTYPAHLIVEFTTESLLELKCIEGEEKKVYEPGCHVPQSTLLYKDYDQDQSEFYANLEDSPTGLNYQDLKFTIEQIQMVKHNLFHPNELKYHEQQHPQRKLVAINHPSNANWPLAFLALTFPVVKEGLPHDREVSSRSDDHISDYNQHTTGPYSLESASSNLLELERRRDDAFSSMPVVFKWYDLTRLYVDAITKGEIDIGLSLAGEIQDALVSQGHKMVETVDLNSFTYFGFNFETKHKKKSEMIRDIYFRRAFAYAVASSTTVSNKVETFNAKKNYTFDNMLLGDHDAKNHMYHYEITPFDKAVQRIKCEYLDVQPRKKNVRFSILVRYDSIFGGPHFESIEKDLKDAFEEGGISFEIKPCPTSHQFEAAKKNGDFDIIFDTFYFGRNKTKYIEFLNPENDELNFLKCQMFSREQIMLYKSDPLKIDQFLLKVNQDLPVFVIGAFHYKNAISPKVKKKEEDKCATGREAAFFRVENWEKIGDD